MKKMVLTLFALLAVPFVYGVEWQGEPTQGGLLVGKAEPGAQILFADRKVRVDEDGLFVIGLGRDEPKSVILEVMAANGEKRLETIAVKQREYNIQRVDGVPQRTVTPPKTVLERIRKEAAQVSNARSQDTPSRYFIAGFQMPMKGAITGVYGSQRIYNGTPKNPHYGLDIAGPTGKLVYAPAAGVVKLVHSDMYYSGGTLVVDHGHGIFSSFIHLSEILVKPGANVKQGDVIAKVGATGRATGPHLDWRVNWFDVRLDPQLVMKALPPQ